MQPRVPQILCNSVRLEKTVVRGHADVRHQVDGSARMAQSEVTDVIEAADFFGRVFKLMPNFGIAVIEQP